MSDFRLFGSDLFGDAIKPKAHCVTASRFTMPPFTILDSKSGVWQDRKRAWASLGIKGELGRAGARTFGSCAEWQQENGTASCPEGLTYTGAAASFDFYRVKEGSHRTSDTSGTSIFDPVVCELAYRWWCAEGGQVIDPFAGGSVRGIVAGALGRKYWGCDLRAEQIKANEDQANEIDVIARPNWVCGDSLHMLADAPHGDFLFSCPPYGDLEQYSDDPRDLSAMQWIDFVTAYRQIVRLSVSRLKPNRFACFVVGDFRDNKGFYRNFVSETIAAFEACDARLYNEAILATAIGSASMRVTKQFESGRKLAKTHQNVLVFCKGDWRKAVAALA